MAHKNMLNSREFGVGLLSKNVFYENMTSSIEQHFYVNFAFYNKKEEKLTLCFYPGYLQHRPLLYYKMAVLAVMDYFTANTSLDMGNLETIEILYTEPHGLTPKNEYSTKEFIKLKNHGIFIRQYSDAETMLTLTHQDYMSLKNKSYVGSLSKARTDYLITNGFYTPSVRNCSICLGKSICPAAENNAKEDFHATAKN